MIWLDLVHQASPSDIADLLGISERTVRRYLQLFRSTGDEKPVSKRNGPRPLMGEFERILLLRYIIIVSP